jgi:hypothetical protein
MPESITTPIRLDWQSEGQLVTLQYFEYIHAQGKCILIQNKQLAFEVVYILIKISWNAAIGFGNACDWCNIFDGQSSDSNDGRENHRVPVEAEHWSTVTNWARLHVGGEIYWHIVPAIFSMLNLLWIMTAMGNNFSTLRRKQWWWNAGSYVEKTLTCGLPLFVLSRPFLPVTFLLLTFCLVFWVWCIFRGFFVRYKKKMHAHIFMIIWMLLYSVQPLCLQCFKSFFVFQILCCFIVLIGAFDCNCSYCISQKKSFISIFGCDSEID